MAGRERDGTDRHGRQAHRPERPARNAGEREQGEDAVDDPETPVVPTQQQHGGDVPVAVMPPSPLPAATRILGTFGGPTAPPSTQQMTSRCGTFHPNQKTPASGRAFAATRAASAGGGEPRGDDSTARVVDAGALGTIVRR